MDIKIVKTTQPKEKPDQKALGFGKYMSDHMFLMNWEQGKGWFDARIVPFGPIPMDPAAVGMHYGQETFEGLKAYRTAEGKSQLFRPDMNAKRLANSNRRMCLPAFPEDMFVEAVKALVEVDADWVPSEPATSLYIRPFTFATERTLSVHEAKEVLFCIICSPSGAYYAEGINPIKIMVEDEYVRAARGGTGFAKCGGNYAGALAAQAKAEAMGYSQVLWLDGNEKKYVEEVGSMNIMFKINGEVWTAPTCGTVLPGITRASMIEIMKEWGYTVREERLSIDDLMAYCEKGEVEEVFGTGTAAVISPVGTLAYKDNVRTINNGEIGELSLKLYTYLTDLQWGRIEDTHGWIVPVC